MIKTLTYKEYEKKFGNEYENRIDYIDFFLEDGSVLWEEAGDADNVYNCAYDQLGFCIHTFFYPQYENKRLIGFTRGDHKYE